MDHLSYWWSGEATVAQLIATHYNKASFISTNQSHSLFRRKQNVQNISLKRVEDISKQYLLILYIIVRYVHTSNLNYMIIKQHLRLFSSNLNLMKNEKDFNLNVENFKYNIN